MSNRKQAQTLIELARETIESYIRDGITLVAPLKLGGFESKRAGIFVTLHQDKNLRGCIGTILATQPNILEETIQNAISAATRDPRFSPVLASELPTLDYEVSVLHEPEPIQSLDLLDVKKFGVIVSCDHRRGLLLPDLDGIDTVEAQVNIAMQKGGISPNEMVHLQRFQVDKYTEASPI